MSSVQKRRGGEIARSLVDEACADCILRCSLLHGKNNLSPRIASFCKFMIGNGWEDSMPLPPGFARTVPGLENKKTRFIDSDRQSWEVLIHKVGGCISFQRGWNAFVLAHDLRAGYVLCFHYIEPHFVVKIYNETACELAGFSGKNHQGKRPKTKSSPSNYDDSSCFIIGEVSAKKQCSGSRAAAEKCQSWGKASDKGKSPIKAENPFDYKTSLTKDGTWYTGKESMRKQYTGSRSCVDKSQSQGKSPMMANNTFSTKNSHGKDGPQCTVDERSLRRQCSGYRLDVDKSQSQGKANDMRKSRTAAENTFSSENIYEKSSTTCKASCSEEPFYMIDGGFDDKQGEDKNSVFDLSRFETGWNSSGVARENIAAIKHERSHQVEVVMVDEENLAGRVVPSSAPVTKMILKRDGSGNVVKIPSIREKTSSVDEKSPRHVDASPISAVKPGMANKEDGTVAVPSNTNGSQMKFKDHCSKNVSKLLPDKRNCHGETSKPPLAPSAATPFKIEKTYATRSSVDIKKFQVSPGLDNAHLILDNSAEPLAQNDPMTRFQKEGAPLIDSGKSLQQTVIGALKLPRFHVRNRQSGETMVKAKGETAKTEPKVIFKSEPMRITKTEPKAIHKSEQVEISPRKLGNYEEMLRGTESLAQNSPALIDSGKSLQQTVTGALKLPTSHVQNRQSGETMLNAKRKPTETAKTEPTVIVKSEPAEITPRKLGNYEDMLRGTGVVKTDPPDCSFGASSLNAPIACSVVVTRNLHSLELPTRLPSANKERHPMKWKVVYLHDPLSRLWPVLYHDRLEFKLITTGWEAFCKANDIQLGDKCTFEVENGPKDIYKVSVLRN